MTSKIKVPKRGICSSCGKGPMLVSTVHSLTRENVCRTCYRKAKIEFPNSPKKRESPPKPKEPRPRRLKGSKRPGLVKDSKKPELVGKKGTQRRDDNQKKEGCSHYWIIESPGGLISKGICKACGAESDFLNYFLFSSPDNKRVASISK